MVKNGKLLDIINKEVGETALVYGDSPELVPEFLTTGFRNLDVILGGGLRKGSFVLVTGDFSSGKSLMTQYFIKAAQDAGLETVYIDAERAFNYEWMAASGVDLSKLMVSQVSRGAKAFDLVHTLIKHKVGLIVIDSLAALLSDAQVESTMAQEFVGVKARMINKGIEKALAEMEESDSTSIVVAINQLRAAVGGGPGQPQEVMPGGRGQWFYAHLVLKVRRAGWLNQKSAKKSDKYPQRIGYTMSVQTEKSKQSAPFQNVRIPFNFRTQLDAVAAIVYEAIDYGVVPQRGSYFQVGEEMIQGRTKLLDYARANPEYLESLTVAVEKIANAERVDDTPSDSE